MPAFGALLVDDPTGSLGSQLLIQDVHVLPLRGVVAIVFRLVVQELGDVLTTLLLVVVGHIVLRTSCISLLFHVLNLDHELAQVIFACLDVFSGLVSDRVVLEYTISLLDLVFTELVQPILDLVPFLGQFYDSVVSLLHLFFLRLDFGPSKLISTPLYLILPL